MPNFHADAEYQMLRDEIVQGKKYVFERPILIVAACVTLAQFDRTMLSLLPIAVLGSSVSICGSLPIASTAWPGSSPILPLSSKAPTENLVVGKAGKAHW
jgi:hypothetical protein